MILFRSLEQLKFHSTFAPTLPLTRKSRDTHAQGIASGGVSSEKLGVCKEMRNAWSYTGCFPGDITHGPVHQGEERGGKGRPLPIGGRGAMSKGLHLRLAVGKCAGPAPPDRLSHVYGEALAGSARPPSDGPGNPFLSEGGVLSRLCCGNRGQSAHPGRGGRGPSDCPGPAAGPAALRPAVETGQPRGRAPVTM